MATLAAIQAALVEKVIADLSPTVELEGPLARSSPLAAGVTAVRALGLVVGQDLRDSNLIYATGHVGLAILHRLAAPATPAIEQAYLEGAFQTDQQALVDRRFWQVTGVYEVVMGEVVVAERTGNVVEYTVDAQLSYLPS